MDIKQRLRQAIQVLKKGDLIVVLDTAPLFGDALAEIERLEKIEAKAKELYEYRQDAFPGILAAENMQLVLDGLECDLFPERFRDSKDASNR